MRESPSSRRAPSRRAFIPLFLFGACLLGAGGTPPTAVPQPQTADNAVCPAYDASTLPVPLPASPTVSAGATPGTFAVSAGGQATYTLPLALPPGRLGMEPRLAIAYDSSRGEGPLGVGFALQGLSAITRCPANMAQDGRIRAVRNDTEDHFCLDGVRLVDIPNSQGHDGYHTREWRTFPDTQRKVVSHDGPDFGKGPQHWAVYEKDGRIREYGATPDSQAMALHGTVAAWHLASESDRRGNAVDYTYQNDPYWFDGHTQEIRIKQIDYTRHGSTAATRRVSFEWSPDPVKTLFVAGLSVIKSHVLVQVSAMTLPDEAVVRSYTLNYQLSKGTQRTTLEAVVECAGDNTCKPPTRFSWSDNPPGFTWTTTPVMVPPAQQGVQLDQSFGKWTLADVNGDSLPDIVLALPDPADETFDIWTVALNTGGAFAAPEQWARLKHPGTMSGDSWDGTVNEENWTLTPMDYDQDGLTDILLDTPNPDASTWPKYRWLRSRPDHTFELRDTAIPQPPGIQFNMDDPTPLKPWSNRFARVGDINGDGVGDLIECRNPTWNDEGYNPTAGTPLWSVHFWIPDVPSVGGPGWDENPIPIPGTSAVDCAEGLRHVHVIDIDGDGVSEIVMPQWNGSYGALRWENGAWVTVATDLPLQQWTPGGAARVVHWLDANGDGLPDAILTGMGTWCTPGVQNNCETPDPYTINGWPYDVPFQATNNGKLFGVPEGLLLQSLSALRMTDWWGDQGLALDYDGDGRADFMLPVAGTCADHSAAPCWVVLRSNPEVNGYNAAKGDQLTSGVAMPIPTNIGEVVDPDTDAVHTWFNPVVTDVNQDGRHDLVAPTVSGDGTFTVYTNNGPQDLLVAVTDGMSALDPGDPGFVPTVSIHYETLVDWSITNGVTDEALLEKEPYIKHADAQNGCDYPRSCVVGPARVVNHYSLNDGRNQPRTFSVRYRDGRFDRLGRGMLGFADRIVVDDDTGAGRAEHYDNVTWDDTLHVYPFAGQVVKSWSWSPAAAVPPKSSGQQGKPTQVELAYTKTTLQEVPTDPSTFFTLPIVVEQVRREGTFHEGKGETLLGYVREAQSKGSTLLGDTFSVVNSYDSFGNVLSQDTYAKGVDLDENVTRIVENDTGRWLIGEVKYEETSSNALGRTAFRRTERTFNHVGEVTHEVSGDPLDPDTQLTADYHRDGFGNITLTTAYDEAGHYRSACTSYEPQGIFPYATANQAGHTTLFDYDGGLGVLVSSVDPNGLTTLVRRDGFGRVTEERHADGSFTTHAISRHKDGGPKREWWAVKATSNVGGGASSTRELDSLGRPVRAWAHVAGTKSCGASKCAAVLDLEQATTYDHLGRVSRVTVPWMTGDALSGKHADTYEHDAIGRTTQHVEPWGRKTTYAYAKNAVTTTDWLGTTKREADALGRTVETIDKNGGAVKTAYGPWSLPHTVTRFGNETTTTERDAYGRVVEEDDPDRGKTVTRYDGFGEVFGIDDAADRHFGFLYDGIGRLVERDDTVQGQTRSTQWAYDTAAYGVGKIAQATSPEGHVDTYTYTPHSQLWRRTLTFEDTGESFEMSLGYDGYGRVDRVHYPHPAGVDPLHIHRDYDAFGNVVAVRDDGTGAAFWQLGQLDGAGRPTKETLGNGVVVRHDYAPESGLVKSVEALGPAAPFSQTLQHLDYAYDLGLRMASRADELQAGVAGSLTEGFGYDAIDRLTCAAVSGWLQTSCAGPIAYEDNGNIKEKDGLAYTYDPAHPHAVKTVGPGAYVHDPVGNQTQRPDGTTIAYTPFDLPESYSFEESATNFAPYNGARFAYDGGQHRIRKTLVTPGGASYRETAYLDELYERVRDAGGDQHRFYVPAGSAMVVLTRAAGGNDQAAYLLKDALGSVDVVTDGSGGVVERRSYDAFGARRNPQGWGPWQGALASAVTPVGFEGLEADDEAGLVNMRGRVYDPKLGRFLSTDPLVSRPGFAQSWNPYSYVLNSPLNFADPSGFDVTAQGDKPAPVVEKLEEIAGQGASAITVTSGNTISVQITTFAPRDAVRDDTQAKTASGGSRDDAPWLREPEPYGGFGATSNQGVGGGTPDPRLSTGGGGANSGREVEAQLTPEDHRQIQQNWAQVTKADANRLIGWFFGGAPAMMADPVVTPAWQTYRTYYPAPEYNGSICAAPPIFGGGGTLAGTPPKVTISAGRYPGAAAHIEEAQAAGKPARLTIDRPSASANRSASLKGVKTAPGMDRDEYPPAMFKEGGAGASVKLVPSGDNRGAGACMGGQCRSLPNGTTVDVEVVR